MTVLNRLLRDRRRGLLWWTLGTTLGVASIIGLWPTIKGNTDIEDVVQDLPAGVRAMFGMEDAIPLSSAPGYLNARLFSTILPILLVIYAIGLGARAIGGAEEDGTLQLVATAPVTRRRIALERLGASILLVLWIVFVSVVTMVGLGAAVGIFDDVGMGRAIVATVAVAELALLVLAIAFAAGATTGRRAPAMAIASSVAVGGFVLHGLTASAEAIRPLRVISPWWWLLDRNLLVHDPTFLSLGLPLVLAVAAVVFGVLAYERRDLKFP